MGPNERKLDNAHSAPQLFFEQVSRSSFRKSLQRDNYEKCHNSTKKVTTWSDGLEPCLAHFTPLLPVLIDLSV